MGYRQRELFESEPGLIATKVEDQWFDRKSVRVDPAALANVLVGFANADGGTLVIGVENDGTVSGVDAHPDRVNRLRQAAMNFTSPPVRHTVDLVPCSSATGGPDHVLVLEVHPSDQLHRTHRDEVYRRVGDETRRLGEDDIRELAFDKGERPFDGMPAPDVTIADLDRAALRTFADRIGAGDDVERAMQARGLVASRQGDEVLTWSSLLLFGRSPQAWLPGAHVRILRYDGLQANPGTRGNLVFDRRVAGTLSNQIAAAQEIMAHQIRQVTRLDERTGRFVTIPELPEFAWLEAIVNAVTHRSYSRHGDHIRVILFDDRLEVESPGRLPGPVRLDNIRRTRYSRNPRISRTLADLGLVQELNEGMKRLFDEMARANLPEPLLRQTDSGFVVTLYNRFRLGPDEISRMLDLLPTAVHAVLDRLIELGRVTTGEAADLSGLSVPTIRRYFAALEHAVLLERVASSATDPQAFWRSGLTFDGLWRARRSAVVVAKSPGTGGASFQRATGLVPESFASVVRELFLVRRMTTGDAATLSGLSLPTVRRYFGLLERDGVIERVATSSRDPQAYWLVREDDLNSDSRPS